MSAVIRLVKQARDEVPFHHPLAALALTLVVLVSGCSSVPSASPTPNPTPTQSKSEQYPLSEVATELPVAESEVSHQQSSPIPDRWQADMLASLNQGQHAPVIQALLTKAERARQAGKWNTALSYLDQARQIQPRNGEVFLRQGWVRLQTGDLAQAEQLLRRGINLAQNCGEEVRLRLLLVEALEAKGKTQAAQAEQRIMQSLASTGGC